MGTRKEIRMSRMYAWVRDTTRKANKWHRYEDGMSRTSCGQFGMAYMEPDELFSLGTISVREFPEGSAPVDAFGVCLNCLRVIEKGNRRDEG